MEGEKIKVAKIRRFEENTRFLLHTGIIYKRMILGLTWPDLARLLEEKGVKVNIKTLGQVRDNWAGNRLIYFAAIYTALDLPAPTPELLMYWSNEIKRMEGEKKESARVKREEKERKKAERIEAAKNKLLNSSKL